MLARYAEIAPDGQVAVIGGDIDQVKTTALPATLSSVTVVTKLTAPIQEVSREYSFRLSILGPDDEPIHEGLTGTFPPLPIPTEPENKTAVYGLVFNVTALIFPREGNYKFVLCIDGEEVASAPFRVNKLQDEPRTPPEPIPLLEKAEKKVDSGVGEGKA